MTKYLFILGIYTGLEDILQGGITGTSLKAEQLSIVLYTVLCKSLARFKAINKKDIYDTKKHKEQQEKIQKYNY